MNNFDPLKLKQHDSSSSVSSKLMYILLLACPVLIILSLLLFSLSSGSGSGSSGSQAAEGWYDEDRSGNVFSNLQLALHIMPSQNTANNRVEMDWSDKAHAEDTYLGSDIDYGDKYFYYKKTGDYFPDLYVNPDYVPLGNSAVFCINIEWVLFQQILSIQVFI
jgi:hypothetical protein